MRPIFGFVILFFAVVVAQAAQAAQPWQELASELSNGGAVKYKSMGLLRKYPGLDTELERAIGTRGGGDYFRALDVIAALRLAHWKKPLMDRVESDPTGYVVHTLNALVAPKDHEALRTVYSRALRDGAVTPACRVALIDALTRLGVALNEPVLKALFHDRIVDVRWAAARYLSHAFQVWEGSVAWVPLIAEVWRDQPRSVRELLIEGARSTSGKLGPRIRGELLARCRETKGAEMLCDPLKGKRS